MICDVIKSTPLKRMDLHTHSNFCDGKASPEEMVLSAIDKGLSVYGLVTHAYIPFEDFYTIHPDKVELFQRTVYDLSKKYEGKIKLLCGLEADPQMNMTCEGFSYVLGSSHYFCKGDKAMSVDASPDAFLQAVDEMFDGDPIRAAENYFEQLTRVADMHPDIIGHFDLITKFNERLGVIDERDSRYKNAWKKAADELIKLRVPFEINTGGISRGWKTCFYPSSEILGYLEAHGATFVYSSDAHRPEQIAGHFDKINL